MALIYPPALPSKPCSPSFLGCRRRRFDGRLAVEEANQRFYTAFQVGGGRARITWGCAPLP